MGLFVCFFNSGFILSDRMLVSSRNTKNNRKYQQQQKKKALDDP